MKTITSYIEINNITLAAALNTLGIPFVEEQEFIKIKNENGSEHYKFFFQEHSECGSNSNHFTILSNYYKFCGFFNYI